MEKTIKTRFGGFSLSYENDGASVKAEAVVAGSGGNQFDTPQHRGSHNLTDKEVSGLIEWVEELKKDRERSHKAKQR